MLNNRPMYACGTDITNRLESKNAIIDQILVRPFRNTQDSLNKKQS